MTTGSGRSPVVTTGRFRQRVAHLALRFEVEAVLPDEVLRLPAGGPRRRGVHHQTELVAGGGVRLQVAVGDPRAKRARQVVVLQLQQVVLPDGTRQRSDTRSRCQLHQANTGL